MSGEAGAYRQEEYYTIEYLSGIIENISVPPWEENQDYIGNIFEIESKPYEEKLCNVIPIINNFFNSLIGNNNYPLVKISECSDWIYGVIIEDKDESKRNFDEELHGKNWFSNSKKSAFVMTDIRFENFKHIKLTFAINKQIKRSAINLIEQNVLKIFGKIGL